MWLDDDFLYNRHESLMLFNEMIKNNLNITWDNTNGVIAASCTEELIIRIPCPLAHTRARAATTSRHEHVADA